jgi:Mrp family chromosome partitioning ATPase
MLQLADPMRKVYAVTSPTAGDGKTSLSLSLAMSFTAAGARTLLVDFDLIGHGLTSRLGMSRERGIGHALAANNTAVGAEPTSVPGLSLVASGREDAVYASRVSREALAALITRLRSEYDIVIVDTGPILGSLEANLATSIADAVVMVVGRGQHASDAQSAIRHLGQLGARLAGIVFNRANSTDFSSSRSASTSFRSMRVHTAASNGKAPTDIARTVDALGPLARCVAMDIRP